MNLCEVDKCQKNRDTNLRKKNRDVMTEDKHYLVDIFL